MSSPFSDKISLITSATTTIATSTVVGATFSGFNDVSMRQKYSIQFNATGVASGNGVFSVWVSNDGVYWTQYNRLTDNVTNTNAQQDARVATVTLNAVGASHKIYFFPPGDAFKYIAATCVITTDGTYSAILHAN